MKKEKNENKNSKPIIYFFEYHILCESYVLYRDRQP